MKKRFGIISMIVVLLVCFSVCFTACGSKNGGGEDNGNAIDISKDYNYAQIEQKVNELASTDGMYVKIHVTESDTDGGDEDFYIAMGVKGDVYYYLSKVSESYFDLRSETQCDEYSKEDNVWTKDIYYYGTYYTQAQMKQLMAGQSAGVMGWFGYYRAVQAGEGTKTTTTFLNRSCDKYTVSMNYYGAVYNQEVIIDKTTGICLKYSASASYGGEGGGLTIECTEFNTSWNYTLPQVTAANTETHGTPSGGGQGGGSGEGGQGGSGGSGEGGEQVVSNPFVGKRFDVESISIDNDALEAIFENAYIDLYNDGTFEMVSSMGVVIGSYQVVLNYAVLDPYLAYADNHYSYDSDILDTFQGTAVVLNNDAYTMPIEGFEFGPDYLDFNFNFVISSNSPMHADIPADPNGFIDSSDFDYYQVDQEEWNEIIINKGYLNNNYTLSTKNSLGTDIIVEVDYGYIKESWDGGQLYYIINSINNNTGTINYDIHNGSNWVSNVDYYDDLFDWDYGFIPAQFLKSTYSTTGHYYYINRFTYTDSAECEHIITNYKIWFNNHNYSETVVTKIQFTQTGTTYTFEFTNIEDTEVNVPAKL